MNIRRLEGFAGPGGLSEAAHMIGLTDSLGIETNTDACATARTAGHHREQGDIRGLDPDAHPHVEGWISGPPCPTYAAPGLRTGRDDYATILAGSTMLGDSTGVPIGDPTEDAYTATYTEVADARSALVLETLKLALRLPNLQWIVAEQVPAVRPIWLDFAAELAWHRWESCHVVALRADDFGAPNRRTRVFLIAARQYEPDFTGMPIRAWWRTGRFEAPWEPAPQLWTPFPRSSMAQVLGWPTGVRVNTRGNRKTSGGNEFSADGPAPSLTGKARSWYRTDLGPQAGKLTAAQAGLLQSFPAAYPWQGSRTSQFQQVADSVPPLMGAAVLGAATRRPWQPAVWRRLEALYGHRRPDTPRLRLCTDQKPTPQLDLFEAIA